MTDENIQRLVDNLQTNREAVRERFRQDPVQVMHEHGVSLNEEQQQKVRAAAPTMTEAHFASLTTESIQRWL